MSLQIWLLIRIAYIEAVLQKAGEAMLLFTLVGDHEGQMLAAKTIFQADRALQFYQNLLEAFDF
ncbi:MAG: hypothetical protein NTU97_02080 [Candidatus Magasanikbacteria bacterium]|nr:hypothetical protein [Candidatus Magasanikbacteria bacterium]